MRLANVIRGPLAAAVLSAFTFAAPVSAMSVSAAAPGPTKQPTIEVTPQDVNAANEKIAAAYGALVNMWTTQFQHLGERFAAPHVVRYRRGARTSCGPIGPYNAEYCPRSNTIFYDEVFVAGMAKAASNSLGTDFRIWNSLIAYLPADFRIIRYDKRGTGQSGEPRQRPARRGLAAAGGRLPRASAIEGK